MVNAKQKKIIEQVINVIETGTVHGRYHAITVMRDGVNRSRQITYGRSQTTEQGNLKLLLEMYIARHGVFANQFRPYIPLIKEVPLADNTDFKRLLRRSALEDPIMPRCQDDFFEQIYYQPAEMFFKGNGFKLALSMLVIYDSYIHSGHISPRLRNMFPERTPVNGGDEKKWTSAYVDTRHQWLATNGNLLLRKTIYRTQCFKDQIRANNWELDQPVKIQGHLVKGE